MDDDNAIRRNLVAVSAGIVLAAWLELPAASLLGAITEKLADTPQYKFWALGFALLTYLGVRYRFSEDGKSFNESLGGAVRQKLKEFALPEVIDAVEQWKKTGIAPPFFGKVGDADAGTAINESDLKELNIIKMEDFASTGVSHAIFLFEQRGGPYGPSQSSHWIELMWGPSLRRYRWQSRYFGFIYSEQGIRVLAPLAMGFGAEIVLWTRVINEYFK